MTRKERILILLLASVNFTHILDFMIMMPLGNYLMPYFHISPRQFSFLVAAYTFSAAASGFTAALFVDRYDRKKILIFGYVGFLLGTFACGFAPTYELLLGSRILAGIFGGLIGAQVLSIISDIFGYERRGVAMGAVMSSFAISSIIGVPFALFLANIFSWHAPFIFVGLLGIVIVFLITKFVPNITSHITEKDENAHRLQALLNVLRNRFQILTLIFSSLVLMGHFLIIPFINPYLEFNKGYSKHLTPFIYLAGGIAAFISSFGLGRIADKVGKLKVFSGAIIASCFLVLFITNMPTVPFVFALLIFMFWFSMATGRAVTAQAMVSNVPLAEQRGSFMSYNSSVQQMGSGLASIIAGFVVIENKAGKLVHYEWVGYLSVFVLIMALLLGRYLFSSMDKKAHST
jgi:DHA1 family inner membrane transport protein